VHVNRFKPFISRAIKPPTPEKLQELLQIQNTDIVHPVEDLIPEDIPANIADDPIPDPPLDIQQPTTAHQNKSRHKKNKTLTTSVDEDAFIVEKVLGKKQKPDGTWEYLLKWKGFSNAHNTYEPYENLNETLQQYVDKENIKILY
jgi:hypothetical protein